MTIGVVPADKGAREFAKNAYNQRSSLRLMVNLVVMTQSVSQEGVDSIRLLDVSTTRQYTCTTYGEELSKESRSIEAACGSYEELSTPDSKRRGAQPLTALAA